MLQKTNTRTGTLVLSRADDTQAVFQPMTGNGTFEAARFATWSRDRGGLYVKEVSTKLLTYDQQCRLCDLHVSHFFWWIKISNGALLFAQAYSNGVTGQSLPYPIHTTDSDGGGSRV